MIKSTDVDGRLRLFRYGLVVVVIITFIVSLFAPYSYITSYLRPVDGVELPAITDFLVQALIYTVVVAVLAVIAYFAYRAALQRTLSAK